MTLVWRINKTPGFHILWKRSHGRAIAGFNQLANKQSPTAEHMSEAVSGQVWMVRHSVWYLRRALMPPISPFPHFQIATVAYGSIWSIERSGVNGEGHSRMQAHQLISPFIHHISHFPIATFPHFNQYVYQSGRLRQQCMSEAVSGQVWMVRHSAWYLHRVAWPPFPPFPHFHIFTLPHFLIG